jgi:hypothetical protein
VRKPDVNLSERGSGGEKEGRTGTWKLFYSSDETGKDFSLRGDRERISRRSASGSKSLDGGGKSNIRTRGGGVCRLFQPRIGHGSESRNLGTNGGRGI